MKGIAIYLLEVMIISGFLYGYYWVSLRNRQFHQYNRFYLLAATVLSLVIPLLTIPFEIQSIRTSHPALYYQIRDLSGMGFEETRADQPLAGHTPTTAGYLTWHTGLILAYGAGICLLLTRLGLSLRNINRLIVHYPAKRMGGIRFVNTAEPGTPFSFFRWLFWNREIDPNSDQGQQIFRHELFHIRQKHSLDLLLMEILTAVGWLNPFFHLVKNELRAIHEFLADAYAVKNHREWDYAELLLMKAFNTRASLIHPFFNTQLKRRIAMITNPVKTSHRYLRKLMVIPLAALLFLFFSFRLEAGSPDPNLHPASPKKITVVIDAGHGGADKGAMSPDGRFAESGLTLSIALAIQKFSAEYPVNIVLTRSTDQFPGNASNIPDGLVRRLELTEQTRPDAFLSIHINAEQQASGQPEQRASSENKIGIATFVASKTDANTEELAAELVRHLGELSTNQEVPILRREASIYVLDKNRFPAVLVLIGDMRKREDIEFLSKPENLEKLARKILDGLVSFSDRASAQKSASPQGGSRLAGADSNSMPTFTNWTVSAKQTLPALVVIDGKAYPGIKPAELDAMIPAERILRVDILKGESAFQKYGNEGSHGVVEVTTRSVADSQIPARQEDSPGRRPVVVTARPEADYKLPEFPGGETAWQSFVATHLDQSRGQTTGAAPGQYRVIVRFAILENGTVTNIEPLTANGHEMETAVVNLIKASPRWKPAQENGRPVNAILKKEFVFNIGK